MRLLRLLLRLYPASFRSEYEEEMIDVFLERRREADGLLEVGGVWIDVVSDTLPNALRVHLDVLRQDLVYAGRSFSRAPGFAATAVAVIALGIGANAAVFSVADPVLLRPLPYEDSERLVKLWERTPGYRFMELSPANFRDWKSMSTVFQDMAAFHGRSVNLVGLGEPRRLEASVATTNLFALLGARALAGRLFTSEDGGEGAPETLVLSYGLWQGAFGGEASVLGRVVRLDDRPFTIIGVLPGGFYFPNRDTQIWLPKQFQARDFEDRDDSYLQVVARLEEGVSLEEARAEMSVVTADLERAYPEENRDTTANVILLRDQVSETARLLLTALFVAAAGVLAIACANLASLLLARALSRRTELAVREALGSGRERLVRQLLTENLVLTLAGGVLGWLASAAAVPFLSRLVPTSLPIGEATALDPRVLFFALLLTGTAGVAFGILPALGIGLQRRALMDVLRQGARGAAGGPRARLRSAFVVAEVTAAVGLVIATGLLVRALGEIRAVDPGFSREGVVAVHTPLPLPKYETTSRRGELYSRILADARELPGVTRAAYVSFLPIVMRGGVWPVEMPGAPDDVESSERASLRFVTPGFFSTLGVPLRSGRDVSELDTEDAPFVAVVSESFVRRYWPDRDPLGLSFGFAFRERTVVGVVGDVRVRGLEASSEPQVYLPYRQVPDGGLPFYLPKELVLQTSLPVETLLPQIRRIVRAADPELPIAEARTLSEVLERETEPRSAQIGVLGLFASVSLLLAAVGIYGLLSFAVSRRRAEIGLRVALGATAGDILRMVLGEGLSLAALGTALGALLGYGAGRAMEALLAGVGPADAASFLAAAALVLGATVTGSLFPALRALRLDPTSSLRAE